MTIVTAAQPRLDRREPGMSLENVPEVWDDGRDGAFFGIVRHLFPPAFATGAGVLLAGWDDDPQAPRRAPKATGRTAPADVGAPPHRVGR